MHARVYGGPKWTVSPVYEGMLKEEMDAAAERHPDVPYQPQLIDVTYAGLVGGAASDAPLVIPALNRDGDCLSELVLAPLRLDRRRGVGAARVRRGVPHAGRDDRGAARHRPGARGQEHREPDGDDPRGRGAAALHRRGGADIPAASTASRAVYEAVLEAVAAGVRTPDLGGHAGTTSELTDEVIARVRTKLEIWSSLWRADWLTVARCGAGSSWP